MCLVKLANDAFSSQKLAVDTVILTCKITTLLVLIKLRCQTTNTVEYLLLVGVKLVRSRG